MVADTAGLTISVHHGNDEVDAPAIATTTVMWNAADGQTKRYGPRVWSHSTAVVAQYKDEPPQYSCTITPVVAAVNPGCWLSCWFTGQRMRAFKHLAVNTKAKISMQDCTYHDTLPGLSFPLVVHNFPFPGFSHILPFRT